MDIAIPIANEITKVSFSIARAEDVKQLAVVGINNWQTFDPITGYPNKGGLYDAALGPIEKQQRLSFSKLYRYVGRLRLSYAGLLSESMELENIDVSSVDIDEAVEVGSNEKSISPSSFASKVDSYVEACFKAANREETEETPFTLTNDYLRSLYKDIMRELINARICSSCGIKSPTLRKEGNSKIFENPISSSEKAVIDAKGLGRTGMLSSNPSESTEYHLNEASKKDKSVFITPIQVKEHMKKLWENEKAILDLLFGSRSGKSSRESSFEQFFLTSVSVPPSKFRPISFMGDRQYDNPQNTHLIEIIKSNLAIIESTVTKDKDVEDKSNATESQKFAKMISAWVALQENVNNLIDSSKNAKSKKPAPGIKQIMEKKEGLFRKHMMGKRVNFAARSVISPDPNIETSEIGVPLVFATRLTYPEPVTQYNVAEMMNCVINGPDTYPGASAIQLEDGTVTLLSNCTKDQRIALASQLLKPAPNLRPGEDVQYVNKKVYRHIRNGDMVIMNRQPTLHKPSMMAHTVKVLKGEKTIRMHYANCNTYNADFDGDEMNMHFPQNAIAQAEARLIMNNDNQYLVPTNGEPLRGLIQDHVVTGVMMTSKTTFFSKEEYCHLVYSSLVDNVKGRIQLLEPAMVKPKRLWTGKQVISTILLNLTLGKKRLNLDSKSQTPSKSWSVKQKVDTEEGNVIFRDGYLLTGVLDKKQFGAKPNGMVHAVYEIYGATTAGKLLTALGRLFCRYVQILGFSCRMEDLVLDPEADAYRNFKIKSALSQGKRILEEFVTESGELANLPESKLETQLRNRLNRSDISAEERVRVQKLLNALEDKRLYKAIENTIRSDQKLAALDNKMKSKTGAVTTEIVKEVIPNGLRKPFPDNGMQLMTVSGAKGSNVNVTQISCMLGQQELEGRRVPVMVSGKTLPSFRAYDLGPRAGGYITGRFLTGIKPQEYYFHCMAGREGLVDTAVKTARSGYLQRCLIKHMEGLKVNYDATVRDSADGSIYQFFYGEDSLDVTKSSYLTDFKFNAQNYQAFLEKYRPDLAAEVLKIGKADKLAAKAYKKPYKYYPVMSKLNPYIHLGAVSEKFYQNLRSYIEKNPHSCLQDQSPTKPSKEGFEAFMQLKYHRCLIEAGEAVGLLAAQSIGEPSTQMTLNTFHFAGHGAKNVTLGIPRLREIIMTASTKPKTPQMTIPFQKNILRAQADSIARKMSRLTLDMVLQEASVSECILPITGGPRERSYVVRMNFCPQKQYSERYDLSFEALRETVEKIFIKYLISAIKKTIMKSKKNELSDEIGKGMDTRIFQESISHIEIDEDTPKKNKKDKIKSVASDDEADDLLDGDAGADARKKKHKQHASYDDPDEDEKAKEVSDSEVEDEEDENQSMVIEEIRDEVVKTYSLVHDYKFDNIKGEWCEFELRFAADAKKLLLVDLIEQVAPSCVISEIPGLTKCFVSKDEHNNLVLLTEGVNIRGLHLYDNVLDLKRLESNDIASIIECYGVEAGRKTIVKEISSVFAVYGIEVDVRHLSLIADYMTFQGGYKAYNRGGIESSASPFAKMSFETAFHFLTQAALRGDSDMLKNPSAKLVLGKVVEGGTGSFEIHHTLEQ